MPSKRSRDNNVQPEDDTRLIAAIQHGLPLVPRPYAVLAREIGCSETEVMSRLKRMLNDGTLKRLGVVVRHHELGYRANAMVVWDVPDDRVTEFGYRIAGFDFITLCYRRARHLPEWPYNLYAMIHGRNRHSVLQKIDDLIKTCGLDDFTHEVLFSQRRFKQRGARYRALGKDVEPTPTPRRAGGI